MLYKDIATDLYKYCIKNNMPGLIGWLSEDRIAKGNYDRNTVVLNYIVSSSY
tara:strand:+ start:459 stop:614 length:156 start_codon:yes stop_codon:yes gene_type:complete